jgi:hypothetical protein
MLQLQQVKDLLNAGVHVLHNSHRSCVFIDPSDGMLHRAHPNDEAGIDWQLVEPDFKPDDYSVYQHESFGSFHTIHQHVGFQTNLVRLVRFQSPAFTPKGFHKQYDYILVTSSDPNMTPETATEAAIDHLLAKGWDEVQAQPLLVI